MAVASLRRLLLHRVTLTWVLVVLVWIAAGILKPGFARPGHLRYLLELASVLGIVAAGQTLVVIAGGIDLSVAAVITFATMILPLLTAGWDTTGLVGAAAVLGLTTGLGLINGLGIVLLRVHPLILTLATATILQGALILIAGGSAISTNNATAVFLGNGKLLGLPMTIGTWILVAVAATLLLHRTVMGSWLFAIGTNDRASRLAGVAVSPTLVAAYGISGFCAGLTGLLLLGMNRQGYVGIGEPYLLGSIAAVVLGGTSILGGRGTYLGTIAGSVLLVTITALITVVNASAGWRSILFGALILGLLLLSGRDRETR